MLHIWIISLLKWYSQGIQNPFLENIFLRYVLCTVQEILYALYGFPFTHGIALYQIRIFNALSPPKNLNLPTNTVPVTAAADTAVYVSGARLVFRKTRHLLYCIQFNFISSSLDELDFYMDKSDYFWDSVVQYIYTNQRDLTSEARPF